MGRRGTYNLKHEARRHEAYINNLTPPARKSPCYIWRPTVPSWEKEFTSEIGLIPWEKFVQAKKNIVMLGQHATYISKIMHWNDTAAEEAFNMAKRKFWYEYNNKITNPLSAETTLPDPDMYIDNNIDWNSPEPSDDDDLMLSISVDKQEKSIDEMTSVVNYVCNRVQQMKVIDNNFVINPTGWDVDIKEESGDLLTGLIVGGDDQDNENVLQDQANFIVSQGTSRKFRRII